MHRIQFAVMWALCLAGGCRAAEPVQPAAPARAVQTYGAALSAASGNRHDLSALLAAPDAYADARVVVAGVVRQVCQRRGCWLELAADQSPDAAGCRVVSQEHAFFVPRDAVGSRARVEGTLEVRTVPAAQVAHMESEGGRFERKRPDGSALEVRIAALGVELSRE